MARQENQSMSTELNIDDRICILNQRENCDTCRRKTMLTTYGNEWSIYAAPDEQKHDFGRCAGVILRGNIRKTIFAFFLF